MRPGPRRSLTHAEILGTAFDLLESKGFDAVSVRGVAGALGLTPTAMYTYYASKDALLHGMAEQVLGGLGADGTDAATAAPTGDPVDPARTRIIGLASGLRARLVQRPGLVGVLLATSLDGPNARRFDEALLAAFTDAGLGPLEAGRAAHAVRVHVLGAVAFDAAEADRAVEPDSGPEPAPTSSDTLWDDLESFPLGDSARAAGDDAGERFAWGLARLLDGVLAAAPAVTA
ncbi:hypothetical protein GCM10009819_13830 [Agromyces tropicus]|uniref:HTH tetR-type domain-containing protein n=1 Tax=Agromyces tropicus TaxID=555371 RepID=A0ABN2UEN5_9MICO